MTPSINASGSCIVYGSNTADYKSYTYTAPSPIQIFVISAMVLYYESNSIVWFPGTNIAFSFYSNTESSSDPAMKGVYGAGIASDYFGIYTVTSEKLQVWAGNNNIDTTVTYNQSTYTLIFNSTGIINATYIYY